MEGGDATLALMGVKLMKLPDEPFIRFAGLLSERERLQALEAATVVSVPSPYESLSLLALEAFAVGTPILANARSEVLVEHCVRSNAGLYYADRDEFVEALNAAAGRRPAPRRHGPKRARVREAQLPVGRDPVEVRHLDRGGEGRTLIDSPARLVRQCWRHPAGARRTAGFTPRTPRTPRRLRQYCCLPAES